MSFDKPPGPFNGDFYVPDADTSVRGAILREARAVDSVMTDSARATMKIPHSFIDSCTALPVPTDPLYVMPKTRFVAKSSMDAASLGNMILQGLHSLCPANAEISTDMKRMRISVIIPGTLNFKVKLFAESHLLVAIRRDNGDWFIFIQIYSSIKKFLRLNGVEIETHI
jgi:hypothetical protein